MTVDFFPSNVTMNNSQFRNVADISGLEMCLIPWVTVRAAKGRFWEGTCILLFRFLWGGFYLSELLVEVCASLLYDVLLQMKCKAHPVACSIVSRSCHRFLWRRRKL